MYRRYISRVRARNCAFPVKQTIAVKRVGGKSDCRKAPGRFAERLKSFKNSNTVPAEGAAGEGALMTAEEAIKRGSLS